MTLGSHGFAVRVPRPELYTLFKYIVREERKKPAKNEKDLETTQQMTPFLMDREDGRVGLEPHHLRWRVALQSSCRGLQGLAFHRPINSIKIE